MHEAEHENAPMGARLGVRREGWAEQDNEQLKHALGGVFSLFVGRDWVRELLNTKITPLGG